MSDLVFEKVGDIHCVYPYLCVYFKGNNEPFMEIAVTDARELELTIFKQGNDVTLRIDQWNDILESARVFLPEALENGEV